jgi:hypothetical protein
VKGSVHYLTVEVFGGRTISTSRLCLFLVKDNVHYLTVEVSGGRTISTSRLWLFLVKDNVHSPTWRYPVKDNAHLLVVSGRRQCPPPAVTVW